MRNTDPASRGRGNAPMLQVEGLDVYYGQAHVLQSVNLQLGEGVLAVVGRNGMGKTTLCRAITGMTPGRGSVQFGGTQLLGRTPDAITHLGVAYVPQGRRVWRSLTVDETLQLAAKTARQGAWTVERVYQAFPRLAERRSNGGAQLSGGEQQMLAIGRALLFNPRLLVMDEPTEGLAPVIVEQVAHLLKALADERSMAILLIEQNLGVALELADRVAIMVNGRIAHELPAAQLAADRALQQRLLGLKAGAAEEAAEADTAPPDTGSQAVLRVVRAHGQDTPAWATQLPAPGPAANEPRPGAAPLLRPPEPAPHDRAVYLAGSFGALQRELAYVKRCLEQLGARVVTVDIAGTGFSSAQVGARELTRHHPLAEQRAAASAESISSEVLGAAFAAYLGSRRDLGALLVITRADTAAVGCGGALSLPAGVPKVLVTDRPLPGTDADVLVMTAPIGELNRVSETLLAHAAAATAGMLHESAALHRGAKPLVCITSLGLAGTAVRQVRRALGDSVDSLVLDMAAGGGATLTRLARSGLLAGVIDLAPVDVSQAIALGNEAPARARFEALAASGVPYVMVPTLLEVMPFAIGQAVPATLLQRDVLASALDGSIVPITMAEAERIGDWLGQQLGCFGGPTRLVLPRPSASLLQGLGGGSASLGLQAALQRALLRGLKTSHQRQVQEVPHSLDELRFSETLAHTLRHLIQHRAAA